MKPAFSLHWLNHNRRHLFWRTGFFKHRLQAVQVK
jgi:hypothetical protein